MSISEDDWLDDDWTAQSKQDVHFKKIKALTPLRSSVPIELAGERLDKVLARLFPNYSRGCLQGWIKAGQVRINDITTTSVREPARPAATIVVQPDWMPEQRAFMAEPVPLNIVHEDQALVVIHKSAGQVVHPAAGHWQGTVLNGLLYRYGDKAASLPRAGIVHRLDMETSGLMVIARTLAAQTHLVRQLQAHTVKRCYLALVWGVPAATGTIDAPIGRARHNRRRMAATPCTISPRPARTHYQTIAIGEAAGRPVAAVRVHLETGRTHQIRVHFAHIGHPLIGDPLYGRTRKQQQRIGETTSPIASLSLAEGFTRQALHAAQLELVHPFTGHLCRWFAPMPMDLVTLASDLKLPVISLMADRIKMVSTGSDVYNK